MDTIHRKYISERFVSQIQKIYIRKISVIDNNRHLHITLQPIKYTVINSFPPYNDRSLIIITEWMNGSENLGSENLCSVAQNATVSKGHIQELTMESFVTKLYILAIMSFQSEADK